jgi:membrane AbrB-like protein
MHKQRASALTYESFECVSALGVGIAGGVVAVFLHLPAPWLLGSMLAVAVVTFAKLPLSTPPGIVNFLLPVIGVSLGSGITQETVASVVKWPASLGGLLAAVALSVAASSIFLIRRGGWDRSTAFFASVPGALAQVLVYATHTKANVALVTLTQMFRLLMLMLTLPFVIKLFTHLPTEISPAAHISTSFWISILEIGAGVAVGYPLLKLRVPAALLIGGMVASATAHLSGLSHGILPNFITIPCQVAFGTILGQRFQSTDLKLLKQAALPTLGAFSITLIIMGGAATVTAWGLHLPIALLIVAFAPGALEVMAFLAFVLGINPVFVAVHHLVRFVSVSLILPFIVKRFVK